MTLACTVYYNLLAFNLGSNVAAHLDLSTKESTIHLQIFSHVHFSVFICTASRYLCLLFSEFDNLPRILLILVKNFLVSISDYSIGKLHSLT